MLTHQEGYPVAPSCAVVGLARSSFYHRPKLRPEEEDLQAVVREFPTYGSRRVTAQLKREGWEVNRKRIRRLRRQMGLSQPPRRRGIRTTQSRHPHPRYPNLVQGRKVSYPDQVWVSDITYIRLQGGFVYLAVSLDVFTRRVRGWQLGRSLDSELTLTALERALAQGRPQIHHSDQGIQYASPAYVERLIRTIKEEEVELADYRDFAEAYEQIGHFLEEVYAKKRIHSALGYLTPAEFEAVWHLKQAAAGEGLLSMKEPKCVQL